MRKSDITVGEFYVARVSQKLVVVMVVGISSSTGSYHCINKRTGRSCYMRTAGRFHRPATQEETILGQVLSEATDHE